MLPSSPTHVPKNSNANENEILDQRLGEYQRWPWDSEGKHFWQFDNCFNEYI